MSYANYNSYLANRAVCCCRSSGGATGATGAQRARKAAQPAQPVWLLHPQTPTHRITRPLWVPPGQDRRATLTPI